MAKPRVKTSCVADKYAGPNERIVEFYDLATNQGGLISFASMADGRLIVEVYNTDPDTEVRHGSPKSQNAK